MNREQENAIFDTTREAVRYLDDETLEKKAMFHKEAILDEREREVPTEDIDTEWIEYNDICLSACFFEQREREVYPFKPRKYNGGK